jgi:pilus assembly protein CpaE
VDIGQQMNESSLKILEISDFVFVVAVQSLPCLAHLNKILVSFRNLGYPREDKTGIILNRYTRKSNIALEDVEASLKKRIMWTIPNDYAVTISAINKGQPLNRFAPDHSITESIQQLADTLTDEAEQTNGAKKKKWWWF